METNYRELSAPIFNIQTFSIHDGPGIRVTVFVKGCPLRCLWCANPESNLCTPQLMTYSGKCVGCGKCLTVCPNGAISIKDGGKPCAVTDREKCRDCGECVSCCPVDARELVGETMTVSEVLSKVEKDRFFIDATGGGITVSGGEPLMHPEFTRALLCAAKEEGLSTAMESCSFASREVIDMVYEYLDFGLLDIKHMDSDTHKKLTGVPNEPILENLRHIYHDLKVPFMISLPIIPGYNDTEENLTATARFISRELGSDVAVRLLPYHRLGESKNDSLGKENGFDTSVPDDGHMNSIKKLFEDFGLTVQIGG